MTAKALTRWYGKLFNTFVAQRLRANPQGSLNNNHLLISMTGHKSGRRYTFPVNYRHTPSGTLVISTEASWWRNLEGGAAVNVLVAGENKAGWAEPITDDPATRETYGRLLAGFTWRWFANSLVVIEIVLDADVANN